MLLGLIFWDEFNSPKTSPLWVDRTVFTALMRGCLKDPNYICGFGHGT
jgi:hypothetical protein